LHPAGSVPHPEPPLAQFQPAITSVVEDRSLEGLRPCVNRLALLNDADTARSHFGKVDVGGN